jgi:hypothetical protein
MTASVHISALEDRQPVERLCRRSILDKEGSPPCRSPRTVEQKKALYAAIADNLTRDPGMRREDIFISLVEVKKQDWSFGNGIAQYAT